MVQAGEQNCTKTVRDGPDRSTCMISAQPLLQARTWTLRQLPCPAPANASKRLGWVRALGCPGICMVRKQDREACVEHWRPRTNRLNLQATEGAATACLLCEAFVPKSGQGTWRTVPSAFSCSRNSEKGKQSKKTSRSTLSCQRSIYGAFRLAILMTCE